MGIDFVLVGRNAWHDDIEIIFSQIGKPVPSFQCIYFSRGSNIRLDLRGVDNKRGVIKRLKGDYLIDGPFV